jgi:uncharacterized membrane protein YccF (DUF307 family)
LVADRDSLGGSVGAERDDHRPAGRALDHQPLAVRRQIENGEIVSGVRQRPFLLRAIYFVLIGWWLSGLWMAVAYVMLISIIGLPIAFWMYGRIGAVTTLFRT